MQTSAEMLFGIGLGLFTALLWAISTNVYKSQSNEATPLAITALKMWLALLFMSIIVVLPFRTAPFYIPTGSLLYLVASVTVGLIVGDIIYLVSQERIGVSYAFPIANIFPITTYILAIFLVGEEVVVNRFLGVAVAVIGVALISNEQNSDLAKTERPRKDLLGIGLAFAAALCWTFGTVFLQIGVTDVDPLDATYIRMLFGSAILVPIYLGARRRGMSAPTGRATKVVLLGSFLGMSLGTLTYTVTVKIVGAAVASLLGSTSPLFALPISMVFLRERPTYKSGIGVLLTVLGITLVVISV